MVQFTIQLIQSFYKQIFKNIYTNAFSQQESVINFVSPYSFAVDDRDVIFKPLNCELKKFRKDTKQQKELHKFNKKIL